MTSGSLHGPHDDALSSLEEKGLIYTGVLEPPKGKVPEDWEPRPQTLFKSSHYGDDVEILGLHVSPESSVRAFRQGQGDAIDRGVHRPRNGRRQIGDVAPLQRRAVPLGQVHRLGGRFHRRLLRLVSGA